MSLLPVDYQSSLTAVDFDPFADGELLLTAPATESQKEIWASVQMGMLPIVLITSPNLCD